MDFVVSSSLRKVSVFVSCFYGNPEGSKTVTFPVYNIQEALEYGFRVLEWNGVLDMVHAHTLIAFLRCLSS